MVQNFPPPNFNPFEEDFRKADTPFQFNQLLRRYPLPLLLGLSGLILIAIGLVNLLGRGEENQIEILTADSPATASAVTSTPLAVDVAGAVLSPGLYQLAPGARLDDVLIAAGGLSPDAHRDWVAQHLNRARKLTDGEKIYIPFASETDLPSSGEVAGNSTSNSPLVSINTASKDQLDTLWGIGPATAQNIIDNRPYSSLSELLDRKVFKSNVWERNKDKLSL